MKTDEFEVIHKVCGKPGKLDFYRESIWIWEESENGPHEEEIEVNNLVLYCNDCKVSIKPKAVMED